MSAKRSAAVSRDLTIANWIKGTGLAVALLGVVGLCILGAVSGDGGTTVPSPSEEQRRETVQVLERNADQQGICYGWRLADQSNVVSVGSNLGDGVAVDDRPVSCPRWVQVVVDVTYTSESSELEDSVWVQVQSASSMPTADYLAGLRRFGLDDSVFLDDPGWAVCRAAVVLPLLAAEAGLAEPLTAPPTPSAEPPAALPDAGSDFLRDRFGYLLGAFLLLVVAAVLLAVGWFQRRHARAVAAGGDPGRRPSGGARSGEWR